MVLICIKQHLGNDWRMKKLSNTEAEVKKSVAYKKERVSHKRYYWFIKLDL